MFGNQRNRLLREDPWPDADALAQELYAMFLDGNPAQFPEGIALDTKNGPPITIDDNQLTPGADTPILRVMRGGFNFDLSIDGGGNLQYKATEQDGTPAIGIIKAKQPKRQTGGGAFPGKVIEMVSPNVYRMTAYPDGRSEEAVILLVTQLEGDPNYPHAADKWAYITLEPDGTYSMNIPTWA